MITMMNSNVAFMTDNNSLTPLCYHNSFPIGLSFEILNLIYVVDFVFISITSTTYFTNLSLKTAFKGSGIVGKLGCQLGYDVNEILTLTIAILSE